MHLSKKFIRSISQNTNPGIRMYQTKGEKKTEGQRQVDMRDHRVQKEKGSSCG